MTDPLFTHHLSVNITPDMDRYLEDLARTRTRQGSAVSKAHLMREALRLYLDQQADLSGSRKQIAKSVEGRLEQLSDQVSTLTQQVGVLDQRIQAGQHEIGLFRRAMQPLVDWVESRRAQANR